MTFSCEWSECCHQHSNEDNFYRHVSSHIPELKVVPAEDSDTEMYECSWMNCSHNSTDPKEMVRHVKYHGYLSILKAKGVAVAAKKKLPPCSYTESESNAVQPWSKPLICQWFDCPTESEFSGLREFIVHVQEHILQASGTTPLRCGWSGCSFSTPVKSKLVNHVRVHTGGRDIACVCGNTFISTTKFIDHCVRQKTTIDEDSFKCDYCFSYFPSERIFRDHMRQHVNHHKCSFCSLTCHRPSVLIEHIRYRHLPYKPFKCSSCSYSCKSAFDLKMHLKKHAKDVSQFTCNEENCDFRCSRQAALIKHLYEVHGDGTNKGGGYFACHLCDRKFARGTGLTMHLGNVHNIEKPPGYSRFNYRQEGDGCFRLRAVRLESLEVMEATESDTKGTSSNPVNIEVTLMEEENVDDPGTSSEGETPTGSGKTIIDVLDEKGAVISLSEAVTFNSLPPNAKIVAVGSTPLSPQSED